MLKRDFAEGKYTVFFHEHQDNQPGYFMAHRYGEPWRDLGGDGMILAMLQETVELDSKITLLKEEGDKLKDQLQTLLAVIHRDGGHYAADHGIDQASKDAATFVLAERGKAEETLLKIVGLCEHYQNRTDLPSEDVALDTAYELTKNIIVGANVLLNPKKDPHVWDDKAEKCSCGCKEGK